MGNLSNVEYVALSFNDFTGSIPREFGLCTRLRGFGVGGPSDVGIPREMGHLKFLTWFDVRFTSIGGEIPDFSNATGLESMFVSDNELEGIVTIEYLPASLRVLVLRNNRLTGPISPSFGNLSNLQTLVLHGNPLEGVIPSEIGSCSKLELLSFGGSYLSPTFKITGPIPKEIGQLGALKGFYMQSTQVYGMIPSSLGNCTTMTQLYLNDNELTGSLPTWLSNMTYLQALTVTTNRLNGPLSLVEWNKLKSLRFLILSRNNFSGQLPYSLGMGPKLEYFMACEMKLHGSVPLSFRNCSALVLVDLQSNELGGDISDALDTLADNTYGRRLQAIMLSSNRFGGSLPSWIGTRFESLLILAAAGNYVEGFIPQGISYLPMLQQVLEDDPMFRFINAETDPPVKLTLKNVTTGFFSLSFGMSILDLSNNRLEGVIPMELSHLVGLAYLNLSHNYLSGPIPSTLSNLTSLIQMDVSHNLSGNIPSTFAGLRRLDYVDFSSNSLVGPIPFGTRYSIVSYLGDAGLCGQILNVSCVQHPRQQARSLHRGRARYNHIQDILVDRVLDCERRLFSG